MTRSTQSWEFDCPKYYCDLRNILDSKSSHITEESLESNLNTSWFSFYHVLHENSNLDYEAAAEDCDTKIMLSARKSADCAVSSVDSAENFAPGLIMASTKLNSKQSSGSKIVACNKPSTMETKLRQYKEKKMKSATKIILPGKLKDKCGVLGAGSNNEDVLERLKKHNERFSVIAAYEPSRHSARDVRDWERDQGKLWSDLTPSQRAVANRQITEMKRKKSSR